MAKYKAARLSKDEKVSLHCALDYWAKACSIPDKNIMRMRRILTENIDAQVVILIPDKEKR